MYMLYLFYVLLAELNKIGLSEAFTKLIYISIRKVQFIHYSVFHLLYF